MLEKLIGYFAKRHILTNLIYVVVILGGIFAWQNTQKEEWPDITFDRIRVSVSYPGAPAEDVEFFVTKPIEEEIRGLDGVYRITSTSSVGQSNITVEIEQNYPEFKEAISEIRNSVLDVELPSEVIDDPDVRVFRSSKKAILDIALYFQGEHLLTTDKRQKLQQYALALENQLLNIPQVNSVNKNGYLKEEVQIKAYPDRLLKYEIPFSTVMSEIRNNNVRKPAGTIETAQEPKVTLSAELDTVSKLNDLIIQGGFEGQVIRLSQAADVTQGYEKNKEIIKINGHEGIMFSVVKNSSAGILVAMDEVTKVVDNFRKNSLEGSDVKVVLLDDESIDIRNRLSLISINGTIGFVLILITLFFFLNKRSGFWVAMGIPFTFCFAMLGSYMMGYTINGMTLSAVIIVMGIVVDDAIVVAENITRYLHQGMKSSTAVVKATSYVILPITASIVTTCVAFVPLFYFTGRYGRFIEYIPPIIFLMLGASLIESIFILPGHMDLHLPFTKKKNLSETADETPTEHWFEKVEQFYGDMLIKSLPFKWLIFGCFIIVLMVSGFIVTQKMKFVMFPNEETRDIVLTGEAAPDANRFDTANLSKKIEDILEPYLGKEVVGYRNEIARSRRGGAVEENKFRMIIEIVPKEKRKYSADQLVKIFDKDVQKIEGFKKLDFQKSRWGSSSGTPIELIVQQNDDELRAEVVRFIVDEMNASGLMENIEVDDGLRVPEYRIDIDREKVKRLSINPQDIASTFRAALEGSVLYEFTRGDEDVRVRFTIVDAAKDDINKVLDLPVENKGNYLVPLRDVVKVTETVSPNSIARRDLKRTTIIDAGIVKTKKKTPLDIAEYLEENVFPKVLTKYPSTTLSFGGEIQDTRESSGDFANAVVFVLVLIYVILAILFNSLLKPLIIMLAIPFGVVGIIIAFWLHGKTLYGFYACVGALGLAGVVINDAIIMLVKLDNEFTTQPGKSANEKIARISQTRLRAVLLTTLTTVAGVLPTAYGFAGYDATLAEMMLALTWGLIFGTAITLGLIPCVYSIGKK
ncbi:MAG: efflux RND transporter permease subunit [Candidatus Omnitrophica bacterium]|nr:efflux RND transporter permease subunit [Candidatus Omnitrophota bacterium]